MEDRGNVPQSTKNFKTNCTIEEQIRPQTAESLNRTNTKLKYEVFQKLSKFCNTL